MFLLEDYQPEECLCDLSTPVIEAEPIINHIKSLNNRPYVLYHSKERLALLTLVMFLCVTEKPIIIKSLQVDIYVNNILYACGIYCSRSTHLTTTVVTTGLCITSVKANCICDNSLIKGCCIWQITVMAEVAHLFDCCTNFTKALAGFCKFVDYVSCR